MAKTIEQIIDEQIVPEMECAPQPVGKKKRSKTVSTETSTPQTVPEVVLPKTKAEMVSEAKGRLNQKTSAVSAGRKAEADLPRAKKPARVKTVELELASSAASVRSDESEMIRVRRKSLERANAEPIWVGTADEIVPFAWRNPLIADIKKPSKFYKQAVREARELMLPVPSDK